MRIVASVRDSVRDTESGPARGRTRPRARPEGMLAYRTRMAALRTRAPDMLRARIRRELRAAATRAAQR